ncbi:hypothetical protein T492DRAFT_905819 [Pavlovales sp. CCMP2436]|nr:hypothetical protein T492DRAFT_905819 [Pavlovales sp. CCMP2436]
MRASSRARHTLTAGERAGSGRQAAEGKGAASPFVASPPISTSSTAVRSTSKEPLAAAAAVVEGLVGFSIAGIIDLLTTVPTMVPLIADTNAIDLNISFMESPSGGASVGSTSLLFLRFLRLNVRILRALRFLRVLRTLRFVRFSLGSSTTDPQRNLNVQRQVTEIILTALSIILEVDASGKPRFEWHDSFYLTVVTISTVGYGDLAPIAVEARLAICFIIMLSLVLIPRQTSRLINMSSDPGSHGKLPTASMRHLVITGNGCLAHATIAQFLKALYAEEQGSSAVLTSQLPYVVLLHHHPLPRDIRLLMNDRNLLDRVSYVRGSALVENDLLRAKVSSSEAVFVLGDPGSDHYAKEDGISLMTCLAVRSYCRGVPMVIQLLSANSIGELAHTLDPSWPLVHAVNVVEIKNLILAKACSIDCFCTFITNLLDFTNLSIATSALRYRNDLDQEQLLRDFVKPASFLPSAPSLALMVASDPAHLGFASLLLEGHPEFSWMARDDTKPGRERSDGAAHLNGMSATDASNALDTREHPVLVASLVQGRTKFHVANTRQASPLQSVKLFDGGGNARPVPLVLLSTATALAATRAAFSS